ncbi:MAG: DUF1080 domain-containing protein [Verrucomicrobia bacterium]|nr:DUF1080 domain-containing protein [Verrucomicrobiota bacterium]
MKRFVAIARRWVSAGVAFACAALLAGAEAGDPFMGRWTGTFRADSGETGLFQLQVVPLGAGAYSLWVRMGGQGSRFEIKGAGGSGRLGFRGRYQYASGTDEASYELVGEMAGDRATGTFTSSELSGTIELARERQDVAPVTAPAGAVTLSGRSAAEHWRRADEKAADWPQLADGSMQAGATDLVTTASYGSFRLHVEFLLPFEPDARGPARAPSGIVVGGNCRIHILDSFAQEPTKGSCGAIFGIAAPRTEACLPPLQWQSFDITVRRPEAGAGPEVTVVLNGHTLHERRRLDDGGVAPIRLRAGGSPVRFRNIWLQPIQL